MSPVLIFFLVRLFRFLAVLFLTFSPAIESRDLSSTSDNNKFSNNHHLEEAPAHCVVAHRISNMALAVANNGTFGIRNLQTTEEDCFTGRRIGFSCEVPKNSGIEYLYAVAFWIGAVVGRDTLVSAGSAGWQIGREFFPDPSPKGDMQKRSIIDPNLR